MVLSQRFPEFGNLAFFSVSVLPQEKRLGGYMLLRGRIYTVCPSKIFYNLKGSHLLRPTISESPPNGVQSEGLNWNVLSS